MRKTSAWAGMVLCFLVSAAAAHAGLPEPPNQHQPWTQRLDQGVPDYVIKTTAALFEAGLADPRGGAYREIELRETDGDGKSLVTHGWVFSEGYAVCWNGLVYPVRRVVAAADLEQDVLTISHSQPWSGRLFFREEPPAAEAAFWFNVELGQTIAPASISLLLRLGRPDLAADLWRAPEESFRGDPRGQHEQTEAAWFCEAIRAWFAMAFSRLIGARERDDDHDSVDVAESLLQWQSRVLTACGRLSCSAPVGCPDLSFLAPVRSLLTDSQRRLGEPTHSHVDFAALTQGDKKPGPDSVFFRQPQAERIQQLIDRLEDVRGSKMGWPGPIYYQMDPIYDLLKSEGEAAVGPLLDVWEHDKRLTRTVDFTRPWYIQRDPIPVSEVARKLLGDILRAPDLVEHSGLQQLRVWWEQHKTSSQAERSFDALADDHASAERWVESAEFITLRSDIELSDGGKVSREDGCNPQKRAPAAYGEGLRSRQSPSVTELLAQRVGTLTATKHSNAACRVAFSAYLWEPQTSLPVLNIAADLEACRGDRLVTAARLSLGDQQAAADWAAIIRSKAAEPGFFTPELLPLWMFPADPVLQETAEWLFAKPESQIGRAHV